MAPGPYVLVRITPWCHATACASYRAHHSMVPRHCMRTQARRLHGTCARTLEGRVGLSELAYHHEHAGSALLAARMRCAGFPQWPDARPCSLASLPRRSESRQWAVPQGTLLAPTASSRRIP